MAAGILTDFAPANCTDLEVGGVSGAAYGINYSDWLTSTITKDAETGAITAIVITEVGSKAVKYELTRGGITPTAELTVNNGGKSGYTHTVPMFLPTKDAAIREEITRNANFNRMVWIIVLDSGIVAQVFGNDVGLALTAFSEVDGDPSKGGGMDVTFSTPADVTTENLPPVEFFETDRATTIAALEALLVAVT